MGLFTIIGIIIGFVAFGLFVALRLCSSDKAPPVARERAEEPDQSPKANLGHRA